MSVTPPVPVRSFRRPRNDAVFAFCFQVTEYSSDEIDEYPRADGSPVICPAQKIDGQRVPHFPIRQHWQQAYTRNVFLRREVRYVVNAITGQYCVKVDVAMTVH